MLATTKPRLFLTVLAGEAPDCAEPLLASEDQQLIAAVARELMRRLGQTPEPVVRPMERVTT